MKLPDKEFYTIQEVAKRWDCSENDVLHFIQMLRLLPSFYLEKVRCRVRKPPLDMESLEIAPVRKFTGLVSPLLFADGCCDKLLSVQRQWQGDLEESLLVAGAPTLYDDDKKETLEVLSPLELTPITFDDFLITRKELHRFEANALQEAIHPKTAEPYLDPSHNHYSKELAVAVNAWRTLYDKGGAYKAKKSHKEQIKATLAGNGLSDAAIDRIATLVNPNKAGGAPSTDY